MVHAANWRTLALFAGFVTLVGLIVWPSLAGRIQYAKTRAELSAIRDAAAGAELKSVGKLFTTLARVIGPAVVNVDNSLYDHFKPVIHNMVATQAKLCERFLPFVRDPTSADVPASLKTALGYLARER